MLIREFQKLMRDLYYERDIKRGKFRTFIWMVEEMGELAKLLNKEHNNENLEEIEKEFADIFAWLCSLANVMGIDLEKCSISKYNYKCPKCDQNPCVCKFL